MKQNQEKIRLKSIIDQIRIEKESIVCSGVSGSEKALLVAQLYHEGKLPMCVVVATQNELNQFVKDIRFYSERAAAATLTFPAYNILPFSFLSYHNETAANRIRTLYQMVSGQVLPVVVTTISAILQKIIPKEEICSYAELVIEQEELAFEALVNKLVAGGYLRTSIVEEPGDFCVRGGIVDIFTPLYSQPLRIELFGDRVDSLRFFSPNSQRTTQRISEAVILPAREAILKKEGLAQIIKRVRERASVQELPVAMARELIERIKQEGTLPGAGGLIPLVYAKPGTIFDYIGEHTLIVIDEPTALEKVAIESEQQAVENYHSAVEEKRICVEPERLYLKWEDIKEKFSTRKTLTLNLLPPSGKEDKETAHRRQFEFSIRHHNDLSFELKRQRSTENPLLPLSERITALMQNGFHLLIVCRSDVRVDRLISLLSPYGIRFQKIGGFDAFKAVTEAVSICSGEVSSGFVWEDELLAIITEEEVFGEKARSGVKPKPAVSAQLIPYEDLQKGDYVVHIDHGIGKYEGLVKLKLNAAENDFMLVRYREDDKLYIPVERMGIIQKYMGLEGIEPQLDKMGGVSWERIKQKVKKSVEKIAGELLKIYAARKVVKGYAFSRPDSYFRDFEAGFPFEETEDQARVIQDVLSDMTKQTPMDRLVCGDVGYGKTEVALRAAFVAVNDSRQVAVLVPTTVLAEQHYTTFAGRFGNYPVNIACLSRFRTRQEQKEIIAGLRNGRIDIVVGTHRLLQKDISFKSLGLVVIDEEQRFGVKHKEKLKKIRKTVDVLALTATPIPRTLYMSLTGIRDISTISTPPEHRHPIITYISEFNETVIKEAIRKELRRKGQLYFVHNNIFNIDRIAKYLQQLVPEVKLAVAHGRLGENRLEAVMRQFVNREIDMLVCTTIIESGLDITSANTILVNRADRFGLAQMYQLRGRVGRSDEQAYAYLFIPEKSGLGKDAQKRLKVLMEHSDLGSGFQIAMSDLRIRGGGTILGPSQSGHIAAVGYEMFLKLMENSVAELKGEPVIENLEPEINIMLSAHIPEAYIANIDQRLSAYRRLSKMTDLKEIADFKSELRDRYGVLPVEVSNLFEKIVLKIMSVQAGVKKLDLTERLLSVSFSEAHQENPLGIVDLILSKKDRFRFTPGHILRVELREKSIQGVVGETKNILKEIARHVNG